MCALSEPPAWTTARSQRLQQQWQQMQVATPNEIMAVDAFNAQTGQPVTPWSQAVMRLGVYAAQERKQ